MLSPDLLKERAREAGADLVGIASAFDPDSAALGRWLAAGHHGTMGYMESDKRRGIKAWYPEAKSVLICGFSYASNDAPGNVARYARLPDYHDSLKERLESVVAWLKTQGVEGKIFVDSSPVLERDYGRVLGWIGKNTMLIHPKRGSYFFLAGIALDTELRSDSVERFSCGSCTRCLDACPTDAFPKEGVLDATKCISYLTIENKGAIVEPLREGVGELLFGCDICQEVCPWNRFAAPGPAFPASGPASLDLEELASLDEKAFKERFRGSPLSRAKRRGLLRNALLAMGNSGQERFRPVLERFAAGDDSMLREQAVWSLARL